MKPGYPTFTPTATRRPETPPELEDATARIEQAKHNYVSLAEELNRFLYDYVKGMVKGFECACWYDR